MLNLDFYLDIDLSKYYLNKTINFVKEKELTQSINYRRLGDMFTDESLTEFFKAFWEKLDIYDYFINAELVEDEEDEGYYFIKINTKNGCSYLDITNLELHDWDK